MRALYLVVAIAVCFVSPVSFGETVYRCQDGKKVTYSDNPCPSGIERRIRTDGGPSDDDVAASRARVQRELNERAAADAATREAQRVSVEATAATRAAQFNAMPPIDPRDNEKVMVHTNSGWDYKTRGQIKAEAQARAAARSSRPSPPPDSIPEAPVKSPNPTVTNCDPGGCWGTDGVRYNRGAGNTMFGSDGRICQAVAPGAPLQCN